MSGVLFKKGSSSEFRMPCDTLVEEGDYVYIRTDGVLDKAQADDINTMPAIGKVLKKPNESECIIADNLIDEDFTGITPRDPIFISVTEAGGVQTVAPVGQNSVVQLIGYGFTSEKLKVNIDPTNLIIRS